MGNSALTAGSTKLGSARHACIASVVGHHPLAQIHFTKLANAFIAAADFFYVPVFPSCFIEYVR